MEEEHHAPMVALSKMADALPGFGIVAAVLGIVITMGAHRRPAGGNRPQGRRRAGRHVPGHFAVVRICRAAGDADGIHGHSRSCDSSARSPAIIVAFCEQLAAQGGDRNGPPRRGERIAPEREELDEWFKEAEAA